MLNIALSGPICSGKTTIARAFVDVLGFRRLAFADELKMMVAIRNGITIKELDADKARYRDELRSYGAAMRDKDPLHWCKMLGQTLQMGSWLDKAVVVDDLRYHNEADYLRERGFVIVAVHTPEVVRRRRHYDRYHADLPLDDESETQSKVIAADMGTSGIGSPLATMAEIIRWYGRQIDA